MRLVLIVAPEPPGYRAFTPDLPDCEVTGTSAEEARGLIRRKIESEFARLVNEGGSVPNSTSHVEMIEVSLPTSLGKTSDTYEVVIDKAPNNYAAWVPNLPICVAVGDTLEEMRAMIKEAMESHIEIMVEFDDPIPAKTSIVEMIEVDMPQPAPAAEVAD